MPSTTFEGRRPQYIEQYARAIAAYNRFENIQQTIRNEQAAVQYLDSLIAQENQTLTALQDVFRAQTTNTNEAAQLLRGQYDLEEQTRLARAGAEAARARAVSLPENMKQQLETSLLQGPAAFMETAERMIRQGTPERADRIIRLAEQYQARLGAPNVDTLRSFKQFSTPYTGTGATGEGLRAQEQAFSEALEAAYFAGEAGIRGGFAGLEVVNLRNQTAEQLRELASAEEDTAKAERLEARAEALEASEYATGEEAFQSALQTIRQTGDAAQISDEYARSLYEEARQIQAYRNDQRADFEPEVLAVRQRVADLEAQKAASPAGQYTDPRMEALRRELTARGVNLEQAAGRYSRFSDSPYYDAIVKADRIVEDLLVDPSVKLEPVDRPQKLAEALLLQYERTGTDFTLDTLRDQLSKADLTADQLNDALAYALARQEYNAQNLDEPGQRERQRQAAELAAKESERQAQLSETRDRLLTDTRRQLREIEGRIQSVPYSEPAAEEARREYARLRAMGKTPEEAKMGSLSVYEQQVTPQPPAPTAFRFAEPLPEPEPEPEPTPPPVARRRPAAEPPAPTPPIPTGVPAIPAAAPLTTQQRSDVEAFLQGMETPPAAPVQTETDAQRLERLQRQYGVR